MIEVKNPAEIGVHEPFPLKFDVDRERALSEAKVFSIVCFPSDKDLKVNPVEISIGNSYLPEGQQPQSGMLLHALMCYASNLECYMYE